jgi:transposase
MPVAYSRDLRHRVIEAWHNQEGTQRKLAERFKVSLSFVRKLLRHYRQTGQVQAKQRGGQVRRIIDGEHLQLVQCLLAKQNDVLLSGCP